MGFFTSNPFVQGALTQLGALWSEFLNTKSMKKEFGRYHDFSTGLHKDIAYYRSDAILRFPLVGSGISAIAVDCADPLLFDGSMWKCSVGIMWTDAAGPLAREFQIYWAGIPQEDHYNAWGLGAGAQLYSPMLSANISSPIPVSGPIADYFWIGITATGRLRVSIPAASSLMTVYVVLVRIWAP